MQATTFSLAKPAKIAWLVLFILLVGAVIFYRERMLFIDAAGMVFKITNLQFLLIPENRYGCFITELAPYICTKLHLPLDTILLAYSISFNLFYLLIASLLVFVFREYHFAILMSLYYTLFASDVFFWTNNEVHQGIAWLFLWLAMMLHLWKKRSSIWVQLPVFLLLGGLTISCHPLMIVSVIFLWAFLFIEGQLDLISIKKRVFFTVLIVLLIGIKAYMSMHQSYDTHLLKKSILNPFDTLQHHFSTSVLAIFSKYLVRNYWISFLVIGTGFWAFIKQKSYLLLTWTGLSSLLFLLLLSIVFTGYHYPEGNLFYLEGEWLTLGIIVGAPFVYYFLPTIPNRISLILLIVIFTVRLCYIGMAIPTFQNRISEIESILRQMRKKNIYKLMLIKVPADINEYSMTEIGLADESILLSKLDGDRPQRTIIMSDMNTTPMRCLAGNKYMLNYFGPLVYPLNPAYFSIDTNSNYTLMSYQEIKRIK